MRGEPIAFRPERWLSGWRRVGGFVTIGEGPHGLDLLALAPPTRPNEPWNSAARQEVLRLKRLAEWPAARMALVDYLWRQRATQGAEGWL